MSVILIPIDTKFIELVKFIKFNIKLKWHNH